MLLRLKNDDLVTAKGNNSFYAGYISHAYFVQDDFDRRVSILAEQMLKRQEKIKSWTALELYTHGRKKYDVKMCSNDKPIRFIIFCLSFILYVPVDIF